MFKVKFWFNVTPSILMVSENGMGMPVIVGDATVRKVHRFRYTIVEGQAVVTKPAVQSRQSVSK